MKTWPVVEVFGPTVQGEGVDQGAVCSFVRFGGCDYACTWCDTPDAVLPAEVRKAPRMGTTDILAALRKLHALEDFQPPWVILSGGNPGLHDLTDLVDALHTAGYRVAVETQGTRWQPWMANVQRLCISPKPPSSGQRNVLDQVCEFYGEVHRIKAAGHKDPDWAFTKVVIFDEQDLEFAEAIRHRASGKLYLSAGNDAGRTVGSPDRVDERNDDEIKLDLLEQSLWLVEQVIARPRLLRRDVFIQSQYHVLLWGNEKGR
jgi:7-carboxy-7-deazaguanine synthase